MPLRGEWRESTNRGKSNRSRDGALWLRGLQSPSRARLLAFMRTASKASPGPQEWCRPTAEQLWSPGIPDHKAVPGLPLFPMHSDNKRQSPKSAWACPCFLKTKKMTKRPRIQCAAPLRVLGQLSFSFFFFFFKNFFLIYLLERDTESACVSRGGGAEGEERERES